MLSIWPQRVTSLNFSSWYHPLIKDESHKNKWNDQLLWEALDCSANSPSQHFRRCAENSMENVHTDVWVWRVNHFIFSSGLQQGCRLVGIRCPYLWNGSWLPSFLCWPANSDLRKDCLWQGNCDVMIEIFA